MSDVVYLDFIQAQELVDRIARRTENFGHNMSDSEKEAMTQLLSDIGVLVDDLICVKRLADNYAINAELVYPQNYSDYTGTNLEDDCLFSWEEDEGTCFCLQW